VQSIGRKNGKKNKDWKSEINGLTGSASAWPPNRELQAKSERQFQRSSLQPNIGHQHERKTENEKEQLENICREWNDAPEDDLQAHDLSASSASTSSIAATPVPAPSSPDPA
jgi:hypothetical protein